jgi:hypothetical protein
VEESTGRIYEHRLNYSSFCFTFFNSSITRAERRMELSIVDGGDERI